MKPIEDWYVTVDQKRIIEASTHYQTSYLQDPKGPKGLPVMKIKGIKKDYFVRLKND